MLMPRQLRRFRRLPSTCARQPACRTAPSPATLASSASPPPAFVPLQDCCQQKRIQPQPQTHLGHFPHRLSQKNPAPQRPRPPRLTASSLRQTPPPPQAFFPTRRHRRRRFTPTPRPAIRQQIRRRPNPPRLAFAASASFLLLVRRLNQLRVQRHVARHIQIRQALAPQSA